jgi:hypothetical protein
MKTLISAAILMISVSAFANNCKKDCSEIRKECLSLVKEQNSMLVSELKASGMYTNKVKRSLKDAYKLNKATCKEQGKVCKSMCSMLDNNF